MIVRFSEKTEAPNNLYDQCGIRNFRYHSIRDCVSTIYSIVMLYIYEGRLMMVSDLFSNICI